MSVAIFVPMKLADLKTDEIAVIAKVNGHGSFRKRLIEMGFIAGKKVRVVLNAPLKDPIEYEILGYKISLRREESRQIEVIGVEEAKAAIHTAEDVSAIIPDTCEEEDRLNAEMARLAVERNHEIRVALVGNPNCGKTSLFNIASGSHEHVGNYSGVTVDAKEGRFEYGGYRFILVDLPGTYSLSAYSPEELYVRRNLLEAMPDVVLNVIDASNIERNLYLTTQLIDMNLRVVGALNMYDEMEARGDTIDIRQLSWLLGIPILPTISRDGQGISELFDTIIKIYTQSDPHLARHIHINHGHEIEKSIDRIKGILQQNHDLRSRYSTRYLSIKYLENDSDIEKIIEATPERNALITARTEEQARIMELLQTNTESAIVDAKYAFIQGALTETFAAHAKGRPVKTVTDKIDAIVTNRWLAFPIFIALLYVIFQATFSLGDYPMRWIGWFVDRFGEFVGTLIPAGWVNDLVVDGIIAGVGSVLVFLPNILILYCLISMMEDSGYMSRAAFIVDKLMHRIGLHGKSFIPMVMGFGCNVPAIMATRAIESRKSRLITIAIIPFMSCSGRLPVFVLLAGAFFPRHAALALLGIYLLGILLALISAVVLSRFIKDDDLPFVMELPPYRVPTGKAIWRHTWEKGRQYLQKMATTILVCSVVIWCLEYFPLGNTTQNPVAAAQASAVQPSYLESIGKALAPALDPLGFSWKMDVGLITGVAAKELVVSSLGVMYAADGDGLADALVANVSFPAAVAFMVFILLYFPCVATFAAVKNETGSWKWAVTLCTYTIVLAWVMAFVASRVTMLLM